jgi:2,5-diamino-6-(ribosylamino)-4(3H)-pyrimidinone 5'-phosphate reductase
MKRPFVFINSAMSLDGKISSFERRQVRISSKEDLERVDAMRSMSDAVMVGVGTVLADDPGLRVKSSILRMERQRRGLSENPLRVVADSNARTPPSAKVLGSGCLIAVSRNAPAQKVEALSQSCEVAVHGDERVDLVGLMGRLYDLGVRRLMVEGGAQLNWSFISLGLVDEINVFIGPIVIGGASAPTLVDGVGYLTQFPMMALKSFRVLGGGILLTWAVPVANRG